MTSDMAKFVFFKECLKECGFKECIPEKRKKKEKKEFETDIHGL